MEKNRVGILNQSFISVTHSLNQLIWCLGNRPKRFGKINVPQNKRRQLPHLASYWLCQWPSLKCSRVYVARFYVAHVILFIEEVLAVCCASCIFHRRVRYRALFLRSAHSMRVFNVWVSSSPPRLPLCQISFRSHPPLPS